MAPEPAILTVARRMALARPMVARQHQRPERLATVVRAMLTAARLTVLVPLMVVLPLPLLELAAVGAHAMPMAVLPMEPALPMVVHLRQAMVILVVPVLAMLTVVPATALVPLMVVRQSQRW